MFLFVFLVRRSKANQQLKDFGDVANAVLLCIYTLLFPHMMGVQ